MSIIAEPVDVTRATCAAPVAAKEQCDDRNRGPRNRAFSLRSGRPVPLRLGHGAPHRCPGDRPPTRRTARARHPRRPPRGHIRLRVSRQPARRARQAAARHAEGPRRARHHLRARIQRGTRRNLRMGQSGPAGGGHAHPRRRGRRLVRQGARPGPGHRRAAAREHVRRGPERRCPADGRRRPGVEVVDRARGERTVPRRPRDPGPVSAQRRRDRHDGPARSRAVARVRLPRRSQGRRRRRRRRVVRRRFGCGPAHHRSRDRMGGKAVRVPAAPDGGPGRQRDRRGGPVRAALGDGARVREGQRPGRRRGRPPRTPGSDSPPPVPRSTRCDRPCSISG